MDIKDFISSGTSVPEPITIKKLVDTHIIVPLVIKEEIVDKQKMYTWVSIPLKEKNYDYAHVIDTGINLKYNLSETMAIMNNYMSQPENKKYKQEFEELQEWRTLIKNGAKKHFNMV